MDGKQAVCAERISGGYVLLTQKADTGISLECCDEWCGMNQNEQNSLCSRQGQQTILRDHRWAVENSKEPSLQSDSGKTPQIKNIIGANKISEKNREPL